MKIMKGPSNGYAQEVIEFKSTEGSEKHQENSHRTRESIGSDKGGKSQQCQMLLRDKSDLRLSIQELLSSSTGVVGVERG